MRMETINILFQLNKVCQSQKSQIQQKSISWLHIKSSTNILYNCPWLIFNQVNFIVQNTVILMKTNQRKSQHQISQYPPMRSLITQDIDGAVPTKRQFDKNIYRYRHDENVRKFKRSQLDNIGDVYLLSRKQRFHDGLPDLSKSKLLLMGYQSSRFNPENSSILQKNKSIDLSASMPIKEINKHKQQQVQSPIRYKSKDLGRPIQKQLTNNSSILSASGMKLLNTKESMQLDQNPYFPQRYRDYDGEYLNKWTGNRQWRDNPTQSISLPPSNSNYFPKWK